MKKIFLFILILFSIFFIACSSNNDNISGNVVENNQPVIGDDVDEMIVTKTFTLSGENFKFLMDGQENPNLIVNEGDKIIIEFTSGQGFHNFVIDELNARTEIVKDSGSTSIEFIADKKGTFEYYCSVGEHRQMGMKGTFIVQ
jgi:plastocyanin